MAMVAPDGDTMAAFVQDIADCHASAYQSFPSRLRGAPLGDYLDRSGPLIARSSRVFEPFLKGFVATGNSPSGL